MENKRNKTISYINIISAMGDNISDISPPLAEFFPTVNYCWYKTHFNNFLTTYLLFRYLTYFIIFSKYNYHQF